jgi:hypothetical protein
MNKKHTLVTITEARNNFYTCLTAETLTIRVNNRVTETKFSTHEAAMLTNSFFGNVMGLPGFNHLRATIQTYAPTAGGTPGLMEALRAEQAAARINHAEMQEFLVAYAKVVRGLINEAASAAVERLYEQVDLAERYLGLCERLDRQDDALLRLIGQPARHRTRKSQLLEWLIVQIGTTKVNFKNRVQLGNGLCHLTDRFSKGILMLISPAVANRLEVSLFPSNTANDLQNPNYGGPEDRRGGCTVGRACKLLR